MDLRDKQFVVFGGAGFIGSHVVALLAQEPVDGIVVFDKVIRKEGNAAALRKKVKFIEGDVAEREAVAAAVTGADGIFHLAALPIQACAQTPRLCFDINVLGTFNIIEAARSAGVRKLVFSSASSVYGDTGELMDESHPLDARTLYGASKIAGEYFLRAFEDAYGLDYVALRYMNVYGPSQEGGLVMAVLKRIGRGLPPVIYGDGSQSFDFVHVKDVARANLLAMQSEVKDEAFNIGSETEVTVKEIVSLLLELTGSSLQPIFNPEEAVFMRRRVGSSAKARRLLGYEPSVDLRSGLFDVVRSLGGSTGR